MRTFEDAINDAVLQIRKLAEDQVRGMSDQQLGQHADALCEMLAVCKFEFDRRTLERSAAAGSA